MFEWASPLPLTLERAESLGLVKACIMREGILASGHSMPKDSVMHGAGALRALAAAGVALVDIDHHPELPESYSAKYGIDADPYPIGHVLDAQAVIAPDGLAEVQCIMSIQNEQVYSFIKHGFGIQGCSVVDMPRKKLCSMDGSSCVFEGSVYIMNSILLDEKPDSQGTWVKPITADDIGTIIQHHAADTLSPVQQMLNGRLAAC